MPLTSNLIHLRPEVRVGILTLSTWREQRVRRSQLNAYMHTIKWQNSVTHSPLSLVLSNLRLKLKEPMRCACNYNIKKTVSIKRRLQNTVACQWMMFLQQLFCMMTYSNPWLSSWSNAMGHFTMHILKRCRRRFWRMIVESPCQVVDALGWCTIGCCVLVLRLNSNNPFVFTRSVGIWRPGNKNRDKCLLTWKDLKSRASGFSASEQPALALRVCGSWQLQMAM